MSREHRDEVVERIKIEDEILIAGVAGQLPDYLRNTEIAAATKGDPISKDRNLRQMKKAMKNDLPVSGVQTSNLAKEIGKRI